MKALSGRESSALALLAQSPKLADKKKREVLGTLSGQALEIARVLAGESAGTTPEARAAARGFAEWAKRLGSARG